MDLSVIIVNWNTRKLLENCLNSIFKQTKDLDYEVIIVDNGSTDDSAESIKQLANYELRVKVALSAKDKKNNSRSATRNRAILKLIENKENLGFAKANNQAVKEAKGKYVLLLNSDTKLVGNALKKIVDFAGTKPNLGTVGPRLLNEDGLLQPSTAPFFTLPRVIFWLLTGDRFLYSSPAKACQIDWTMGAALLVSQPAIRKAGILDERFFMYMEEVEWCYRIKKAGFENWFYPEAEIYHLVRGSSPEGKQRAILGIYEGLVYFYQKHFAPWQLGVLKWLLRTKAGLAWFIGVLLDNQYLKKTYAKAFRLVK